jgi:hypothetical protein
MYFLFSGEGITDVGVGTSAALVCEGDEFLAGPMAVIADQVVEARHRYSPLSAGGCGYLSEQGLTLRAAELKAVKKAVHLPGKKQAKETRYFFNNARILGRIAREKEAELGDEVVAILFRDSDGTASAGRGLWVEKRQSMLAGFDREGFSNGVPMIPKPKSEAWLICALKKSPYRGCDALEERSGNDNSPKSLKAELAELLDDAPSRESLCQLVQDSRHRTHHDAQLPGLSEPARRSHLVVGRR